jgi:hypothetical protein
MAVIDTAWTSREEEGLFTSSCGSLSSRERTSRNDAHRRSSVPLPSALNHASVCSRPAPRSLFSPSARQSMHLPVSSSLESAIWGRRGAAD